MIILHVQMHIHNEQNVPKEVPKVKQVVNAFCVYFDQYE